MQGPHKKIARVRVSVHLSWEAEHKVLETGTVKEVTTVSPELPQNMHDAYQQGKSSRKMTKTTLGGPGAPSRDI